MDARVALIVGLCTLTAAGAAACRQPAVVPAPPQPAVSPEDDAFLEDLSRRTFMKLLGRFVRLANVSVVDPLAFAVSVAVIAAAVALASFGPARRAARLDPSSMLRADA